jgi:hypothetical protein
MKNKVFRLSLLLSSALFIGLFILISCSDNSIDEKEISNEEINSVKSFASVPVAVLEEDGNVSIGLILSAQWYELSLPQHKTVEGLNIVKKAILEKEPLNFTYDETSNKIKDISIASKDDKEYFKNIFDVAEINEITTRSTAVIPNLTTLNNLFNIVRNTGCGLSTAPSTNCTTFRYAVDGCYARAHKMRQILLTNGYTCQKQFVYGNLRARSSSANCCVQWGYHVAVLVKFRNSSGAIEERIFDPSMFSSPVTPLTWRNACKNTSCGSASVSTWANTASNVYYRSPSGSLMYDNSYINTNCVLTRFRLLSGCSPSPAPSVSDCGF